MLTLHLVDQAQDGVSMTDGGFSRAVMQQSRGDQGLFWPVATAVLRGDLCLGLAEAKA